ncbi:MAG TPA: FecR domain-containing protein [Chitinophagaceae bacterium]|nr:FecR domain-containing protein [Chitinophagaceae bacterium]
MDEQKIKLRKLLSESEWTSKEMQWLLNYLENSDGTELIQLMQKHFSDDLENSKGISSDASRKLFNAIHDKIKAESTQVRRRVIPLRKIAIAASVIGIILLSTFLLFNRKPSKESVQADLNEQRFKDDVSPGGDKAILTLGDGTSIVLNNAQNGTLAQQGASKVIKLGGKLSYDPTNKNLKEIVYNTISTPNGGQYQLELPDGSLVWLNATSSIHFPTSFVGKERRVEITGEAYFEVAKNRDMPFIVAVNGAEVQVLGTHFNVNAYSDEENIKTTLLEGSIKFVSGVNTSMVKPGQQSQLTTEGMIKVVSNVDVDGVVAWKNGMFDFENAGIETVMRQLSRWYDVEIEYKGKTDDLFIAEMRRNIKLSDALKALELTGKVKFEIQGKKIIVMP